MNAAPLPTAPQAGTTLVLCSAKDIAAMGGPKKSHLYDLIARGHFPAPAVRLGPRYTRWSSAAVLDWLHNPAAWIAEQNGTKTAEAGGANV
mgnify:CR=1 FL=1